MTPRELDPEVVHSKLALMRDLLDDLDTTGEVTVSKLEEDRLIRHAIERILAQLVDLAVAINGHVVAALLKRAPATYKDSFMLMAETTAISQDLAQELAPSAGLRNVLVHEYADIDVRRVAESVTHARRGYRRYVKEVAGFLAAGPDTEPPSAQA